MRREEGNFPDLRCVNSSDVRVGGRLKVGDRGLQVRSLVDIKREQEPGVEVSTLARFRRA